MSDGGVGISTANFATGTFSSDPNCFVTQEDASTNGGMPLVEVLGSTSVEVKTFVQSGGTPGGAASDQDYYLLCIGPK
jgi:hypothetical protein